MTSQTLKKYLLVYNVEFWLFSAIFSFTIFSVIFLPFFWFHGHSKKTVSRFFWSIFTTVLVWRTLKKHLLVITSNFDFFCNFSLTVLFHTHYLSVREVKTSKYRRKTVKIQCNRLTSVFFPTLYKHYHAEIIIISSSSITVVSPLYQISTVLSQEQ